MNRDDWGEPPSATYAHATVGRARQAHIDRVTDWISERLDAHQASRNTHEDRKQAFGITCPYCGAHRQKPCWQTSRGTPLSSGKVMTEPHPHRIAASRPATADSVEPLPHFA